jgi:hypothetical protein
MVLELNIKPWCNCILNGKWRRQDGFALDGPTGLWVCSRCRKPSKMNYDRLVLGQPPIPQPDKFKDIVLLEQHQAIINQARKDVRAELDWDEEDENDDDDEY